MTVCPQRKPSLDTSFHSPHFHDHWYALRGCRNTRWLTGGAPYGGAGRCRGCACRSFQRFFFLFLSRSTFLRTAAWTVLELSIVGPEPWCTFGKAKQVEPLSAVPPPKTAWLIYGKGSSALPVLRFFEKMAPLKDREKDVAGKRKKKKSSRLASEKDVGEAN